MTKPDEKDQQQLAQDLRDEFQKYAQKQGELERGEKFYIDRLDQYEQVVALAFGENEHKPYGQGKYQYPVDHNPMGDTLAKDMAMVVIAPINLAISGVLGTAIGLIMASLSILPALIAGSKKSLLSEGLIISVMGAATLMIAAVAPFARLHQLYTRVNAPGLPNSQELVSAAELKDMLDGVIPSPENLADKEAYQANAVALESTVHSLAESLSVSGPLDKELPASEGYKRRMGQQKGDDSEASHSNSPR